MPQLGSIAAQISTKLFPREEAEPAQFVQEYQKVYVSTMDELAHVADRVLLLGLKRVARLLEETNKERYIIDGTSVAVSAQAMLIKRREEKRSNAPKASMIIIDREDLLPNTKIKDAD
jgi:hypothetical protein